MRSTAAASLLLVALAAATAAAAAPAPPRPVPPGALERSVVRIVNYAQRPDWSLPWQAGTVRESSGSGVVIEGGLILTNAHVVSDPRLLLVFLHDDPNPHPAKVEEVAHDCDLALVRPDDPDLLRAVPPIPIGGLPELGSLVDTYGYPLGGSRVSLTRGVVSRLESGVYIHSGADRHVIGQTDAAINPGNSGGPVLQDGKIVGIAFQAADGLENVGYFIPTEVVRRFLRDVSDGTYDGYPELGARTSGMENPAARRRAGMRDDETGARVNAVYPGSSADGLLFPGDVLLSISGSPIANDGSVDLDGQRVPFGLVSDRVQVGESVELGVLRQGQRIRVSVPLRFFEPALASANRYDVAPRYFVYAGLLFMPLDLELLETAGENWAASADRGLVYEFVIRPMEDPAAMSRERVVLVRRLDDPVNAELSWYRNELVDRVNGKKIEKLQDLVDAIESNRGPYQVIEFQNFGRFGVLDRERSDRANQGILERYGVSKDRRL